MQLLPLSRSECPVHGGADIHQPVILGKLGAHQLRRDHVHHELLDLFLLDLDTGLNLLKRDFTPEIIVMLPVSILTVQC